MEQTDQPMAEQIATTITQQDTGEERQETPKGSKNGLEGTPPAMFEGNRSKAQDFLKEFRIYWNINDESKSMVVPFKRVSIALARIRGPLVDDWVWTN